MKTAFIGLGVMGYPMAGHLAKAGHAVTVYNRTASRAAQWVTEFGGASAPAPADAAREADIVFACVGRDADLEAVTLGDGGTFAAMKKGALFVDHTTASAAIARKLSAVAGTRGFGFLDAPVSGGAEGARNGRLTIMCGGSATDFVMAEPVMAAYARAVKHTGPAGAGQLAKMVNQICIAGVIEGLAEGLSFARAAGLDPETVIAAISQGAAQSWQMDNRHKSMLAGCYDHGFAIEWMRKDLGICLEEAGRNGASLPVAQLVDSFYAEVEAMGGTRWDISALFARLEAKRKGT